MIGGSSNLLQHINDNESLILKNKIFATKILKLEKKKKTPAQIAAYDILTE